MSSAPRPRRSRGELRALLLEAGAELVREAGTGIGAANVTYKAVFEHVLASSGISVTRGSVHERIWDNQQEFQLDVLRHVAATEDLHDFGGALDAAVGAIQPLAGDVEGDATLRTALRVGAAAFLDAPEGDRWRSWISAVSVFAVLGDEGAAAAGARDIVAGQYSDTRASIIGPLRHFLTSLGLRPRSDLFGADREAAEEVVYPLVATMLHTFSEGANLRRGLDNFELDTIVLPSGNEREEERWDIVGLQALALVKAFFEPVG